MGPNAVRKTSTSKSDGRLAHMGFYGLIILIAWSPFPFASNRPWSWSLLALMVGCLLVLWSVAVIVRPDLMRLSWRRCIWVCVFFGAAGLWAFIQTLSQMPEGLQDPLWGAAGRTLGQTIHGTISADPSASMGGLMRLIAYGGVFWLAAQFARHPTYARKILWSIACVGIAYAVYGIIVFSSGNQTILWYDRWAYNGDLTSTFVSRAAFGAYAGLALLVSLALIFHIAERCSNTLQEGRRSLVSLLDALPARIYVLIAGCFVLATALVLSHSRGAVAVTALGVGAMLTALIYRHKGRRQRLIAVALIVLVTGAGVLQLSGGVTLGRALQLADQGTGRDAIHSLTLRGIEDAPVTGRGLDTFRHLYFRYRDKDIPWESPRYDKAHNTYLELVLELGLVGFLFLMGAIVMIVGTLCSGMVRRQRDAIYPIVGLSASILIGTHSVLDFSVQMPAIAVTYSAILGVAYAQSWRTDRPATADVGTDTGRISVAVTADS